MSEKEHAPLHDLGENLIRLGQAMQDKKTSVDKLVRLAADCGLRIRLEVVPYEPEQIEAGG